MARNHVIDPQFFYELINRFSFDYDIYVRVKQDVDDAGYQTQTYSKQTISGSLQVGEVKRSVRKEGSTDSVEYDFYCKSLYRIQIGDFINYNNTWMICDAVQAYDEYGVRQAHLKVIQLSMYSDLQAYVKFLQGKEIV